MNEITINRVKKWAILFIVWGWLMLFGSLMGYVEGRMVYSFLLEDIINFLQIALPVIAIAFTVYFFAEHRKDKRGKRLRFSLISLWIALIVCMVLVNLIQQNVMHEISFELQHPPLHDSDRFCDYHDSNHVAFPVDDHWGNVIWAACPYGILYETSGTVAGGITCLAPGVCYSRTSAIWKR